MTRALIAIVLAAGLAAAVAVAAPERSRPAPSVSCGEIADGEPAWEPHGRSLGFTRVWGSGSASEIFRIGLDGRGLRRLSAPGDYAYDLAWSPDGLRIAYATFDLAAFVRVVVARSDGRNARVVAGFQFEREPPATFLDWSPDGSRLAFVDWTKGVDVVDVDSGEVRTVAPGATQPAWSPDGRRLAYAGEEGVTVAAADGSDAHVIAPDGALPSWSPDGRRIAYESRAGAGVHVLDLAGGGDRLLDARGTRPVWASSGRLLDVTDDSGRRRPALHLIDVARGRVTTITHDGSQQFGADDFAPSVAPNGKLVAFTSGSLTGVPTLGGSEIRLVRPNGRGERRLTYHCGDVEESSGATVYGTWLDDLVLARNGHRDRIHCGAGNDVVIADRRDRTGRDCESVRRGVPR
jgi:TolB protein